MLQCIIKWTNPIKPQPISAIGDKCSFEYHDYIQIPRHVFYTNELLNKKKHELYTEDYLHSQYSRSFALHGLYKDRFLIAFQYNKTIFV